jgi:superfamily II DNA or RNA helicase
LLSTNEYLKGLVKPRIYVRQNIVQMSAIPSELASVKTVRVPAAFNIQERVGSLVIEQLGAPGFETAADVSVLDTFRGVAKQLSISLKPDIGALLLNHKNEDELFGTATYVAEDSAFSVESSRLNLSSAIRWIKHPRQLVIAGNDLRQIARESWRSQVNLPQEVRNEDGKIVSLGLRSAQIGAIHALAAHITVSSKPGLIVMPTGTGKTEVMLTTLLMNRPERLLVLVPSDLLRLQMFDKFCSLGKLRDLGVVAHEIINPVVGRIKGGIENEQLDSLARCNVVISTVASLSGMKDKVRRKFRKLFDLVYFDEAHHVPSNSWEQLLEEFQDQRVFQFTATPFREDGRRMPGRIIYNFPLRMAQAHGLFRRIRFREVLESDDQEADRAIAEAAVKALREDLAAGKDHLLLARTDSKDNAQRLLELYAKEYGDLSPVAIYSGVPQVREKMKSILAREHRVIVCVDMFGEGFDLPNLKVAALHKPHKSLAVTLQFCGRFTRDAKDIGDATLVANIADPKVSDAIEELYAEDSDWNELIPELSSRAIESQIDFSDFLERMDRSEKGEDELFDLNVLKPKTSTVMYKTKSFAPRQFRKGLPKNLEIERTWISKDKDLLVFITHSRVPIEWATIKETSNEIWDLYILSFDAKLGLLYINSSFKSSIHSELAEAVGDKNTKIVSGEQMFRAFSGINRLIFYNAGLYSRGTKLRFRMYTGLDIADAISPSAQVGSSKSNLFGVGYQNGARTSIGASHKGRIWSMSSSSIPDWRQWCSQIASRVLDASIPENDFLKHTLIPKEIEALPAKEFFSGALPMECYAAEAQDFRLYAAAKEVPFADFAITSHTKLSNTELLLETEFGTGHGAIFRLCWGPKPGDFSVIQKSGNILEIQKGVERCKLADFLQQHPPSLFATDGSEVRGGAYLEVRDQLPFTFSPSAIQVGPWKGIRPSFLGLMMESCPL